MEKSCLLNEQKAEDENIVTEIIALIHNVYNTDEYLKERGGWNFGTRRFYQRSKEDDLEESIRSQKALHVKRKPNHEKRAKESREAKVLRTNGPSATQLVFFMKVPAQADVSASGSAALDLVSP